MAKHNPKLNPSKPVPKLDLGDLKNEAKHKGFHWLLTGLRKLAQELFTDHKMKPRHIRKTLDMSGRQFRKAVKGKRK
jgi:predicted RNA-binding protein (virulence factor B family)